MWFARILQGDAPKLSDNSAVSKLQPAWWQTLLLGLTSLLLVACGTASRVPVVDLKRPDKVVPVPASHVVQKGDALFSIAWRYDRNYKDLALWNGLDASFRIYPGQRLRLSPPSLSKPILPVPKPALPPVPPPPAAPIPPADIVVKSSPPPKLTTPVKPPTRNDSQEIVWHWPHPGPIGRRFSPADLGSRGLDIIGKKGESVLAAADGIVVYAGTGLVGYGRLVIIKHNDIFLSAYAHNYRLLVVEGQAVKGGQKIAELGSSGADRDKLHFQIRREGKPIDPLQFLPPKKG